MNPPSAFGPYRVLHQIGSGVLGPVFRSYDSQGERLLAIKAIKLDLVPEVAARVADALRLLVDRPLGDAAIIGVVDAGVVDSTPYVALAYESGDALDVVLRQSDGLTLAEAGPLFAVLARAVDAAWNVGVGHGALHPRDIFVGSDLAEVRISGFGIAQALESVGLKPPCRRPYAAPERLEGGAWDRRADIYALAAIAHEVVAHQNGQATDAWRATISKALSERPEDRFGTAVEFVERLFVPLPASTLVTKAAPVPAPAIAPAPTHLDPAPAFDEMRTARSASPTPDIDLAHAHPHEPLRDPWHLEPGDARFPWAATVAVAVAGLALGVVGGYEFGFRRGQAREQQVASAAPATPAPVTVTQEVIPDPAPTPTHTPAPSAPPVAPERPGPAGRVVIQSAPAGALAFIDGRRVGETPVTVKDVSLGRHEVRIARPGFEPVSEQVTLSANASTRTVSVKLRAGRGTVAVTGGINVDSRPSGAAVTVDGRRSSGVTPLVVSQLSPGVHSVLIQLAGHKPVSSQVSVIAGEQTRLAVTLEQTTPPGPASRKKFD